MVGLGWLVDWMVSRLDGHWFGWLDSRLVSLLDGWIVGWALD